MLGSTLSDPVVVEVVRNGFVEGGHHGRAVGLAPDGSVAWAVGDVRAPLLPRSCNKPLQAVAMLELGLDLPEDLLAVACSSHSAEAVHIDAVRRILDGAGLDESELQNPPDLPLERRARHLWLRAGMESSRLAMNCSGKHAAMLATCVLNGWSTHDYLSPLHPLQQQIERTVERLTGEPAVVHAVDGCGAPLLSTSLEGLARAFRALAVATDGPERRVASAVRRHPALVSGSTRDERVLLEAVPGSIGKLGAEACHVMALADGRAVALKIADGADRARPVLLVAALQEWGLLSDESVDEQAVAEVGEHPLMGGGVPVGSLRASRDLLRAGAWR